ncbi:25101_t:CDS:2, partial [Gigaspora rosea]
THGCVASSHINMHKTVGGIITTWLTMVISRGKWITGFRTPIPKREPKMVTNVQERQPIESCSILTWESMLFQ